MCSLNLSVASIPPVYGGYMEFINKYINIIIRFLKNLKYCHNRYTTGYSELQKDIFKQYFSGYISGVFPGKRLYINRQCVKNSYTAGYCILICSEYKPQGEMKASL